MLCCKPKKETYDIQKEEEADEASETKTAKKAKKNKKKSDKSEVKEIPVNDVQNETGETEKQNNVGLITPQIEETLVEENEKRTESENCHENPTNAHTENKEIVEDNFEFASHENLFIERVPKDTESTISHREVIEMARQKFFEEESPHSNDKFVEKVRKISKRPESRDELQEEDADEDEQVMSYEQMKVAVDRLEQVASRLETLSLRSDGTGGGASSGGKGPSGEESPFVKAYDGITSGMFAKYLELSNTLGGDVQTQANMVKTAFQALRDFLLIVATSKKPAQNVFMSLLSPISTQITSVQEFREKSRTSPMFNHLSGIAESIPALGWIAVEPTPGPFVKEMSDAGMFYTNRVCNDFREKDAKHVEWTRAWLGTLREMQAYIKDFHTTGASWNPQGVDTTAAAPAKPPAPAGGAPPPPPGPPPPPPPPAPTDLDSGADGQDDARGALFADLNKGEGISSGLKKVTNDMKTHKNPALRAPTAPGVRAGPAPFKVAGPPKTAPKPSNKTVAEAKPPVLELQDKKWMVEYQIGNKTIVIDNTNLKQVVYIYKCQDSTISVKGKVNSINVDNCKKVAVVFDDVVSSIEFVNSQSIQAQVNGKCPTVTVDKTDGLLMYLSKDSLNTEIVTAKSSEMNILVPTADGDFTEFPLPEQYKTVWNGKKFTTTCADI